MTIQIPLLRRTAQVQTDADKASIRYLDSEVGMQGAAARLFGRMLPLMDGQRSIGQIAEQIGEPAARVAALLGQLDDAHVLADTRPDSGGPVMSGEEFYQLHHRYAQAWLGPVYAHPLWERIVTGRASRAQVLGFAFEKYHYIEGAYEHMAVAAANATPEMMPHLARHFIEEYNHGDIYRHGLKSIFPSDVVLLSRPLPTTRALVNFLSESAARYSFGYYAGNEVLQMTENTSDPAQSASIDSFYDLMRQHYPYTNKIIDAFIQHTRADQRLGHEGVFLQMCKSVPPLTRREVRDAMNIVRGMTEHLFQFMEGIDVFYRDFPEMPRVPCTVLSE